MSNGYAFNFNGHGVFTPDGRTDEITDTRAHNLAVEQAEIEWLKTHPDKVFLYVKLTPTNSDIHTWLGTSVATHVWIGNRVSSGFGMHTYRRAVTCQIFGVLYHGWYMESSGDYCRLKKAKRQEEN